MPSRMMVREAAYTARETGNRNLAGWVLGHNPDPGAEAVAASVLGQEAYSAEATALFARMTTQPNAARKSLINAAVVALKSAGVWERMDALYFHAAHDSQAARLNWIAPQYDCVPVNSPAFTADRGYMPDGSSSYLDTQFNPATAVAPKHTQNDSSFGIRSNTDNSAAGSLAGYFDGGKGTTINPRNTSNETVWRLHQAGSDATSGAVATNSTGLFTVTRLGALVTAARNGATLKSSSAITSVAPASSSYRLGSISNTSYRSCQFSHAFIGSHLTPSQIADLNTIVSTYLSGVGVT